MNEATTELLNENKVLHLMTQGFLIKDGVLEQTHVNLNRAQFVSKYWEKVYHILGDHVTKHIQKDYLIFFKTQDDSLVQISGPNIFKYLSEKFGR